MCCLCGHAGGEKLQKAKARVTKLQKDIAAAEEDASKKAVQVSQPSSVL